jgi:hypothetical protein
MAGTPETRASWFGGAAASAAGGDAPIGTGGRALRTGLWGGEVPWGGARCQLLVELGDALPAADALTPHVRVHALACDPAAAAALRREEPDVPAAPAAPHQPPPLAPLAAAAAAPQTPAGETRHRPAGGLGAARRGAAPPGRTDIPADGAPTHRPTQRAHLRAGEPDWGGAAALLGGAAVAVADTARPHVVFALDGAAVASFGTVVVPPAEDEQLWLIQPDGALYISAPPPPPPPPPLTPGLPRGVWRAGFRPPRSRQPPAHDPARRTCAPGPARRPARDPAGSGRRARSVRAAGCGLAASFPDQGGAA